MYISLWVLCIMLCFDSFLSFFFFFGFLLFSCKVGALMISD